MRAIRWGNGELPKYRSKVTLVDGLRFASKLEADRYEELKLLHKVGVVAWFIRKPRFDLGGGVVYEADFLVVYRKGESVDGVTVEDTKGFETPLFKVKKKLMTDRYPEVSLKLLTRKDVRGR